MVGRNGGNLRAWRERGGGIVEMDCREAGDNTDKATRACLIPIDSGMWTV